MPDASQADVQRRVKDSTVSNDGMGFVVVGVTPGGSSDTAVRIAALEAEIQGWALIVVYVRCPIHAGMYVHIQAPIDVYAYENMLQDKAFARALGLLAGSRTHRTLLARTGEPASELLRLALEVDANLLVVGAGRRSRWPLMSRARGQTARRLMRQKGVAVLIVGGSEE